MTINQPKRTLVNKNIAGTAEFTSPWYYVHPGATRTALRISSSDENLTVDTDELGIDGAAYEIDAARAVTAGTPTVLVFDYGTGPLRVRITAAAGDTDVVVEASYNGVPWM